MRIAKHALATPTKSRRARRRLALENLEERLAPAVTPIDLADPSLYGISGVRDSGRVSISADGQLVAFLSNSDDLVSNDYNALPDAFVFNRTTGEVTLVSVGPTGLAGGIQAGRVPVISPDGRFVAFESNTQGILPDFTNDSLNQIYLRDLQTDTTSLITPSEIGSVGGNHNSFGPVFSADSHHVAFLSLASNLTTEVTFLPPVVENVFVRDLITQTTKLVSRSLSGTTDGNAGAWHFNQVPVISISADGRFIAFLNSASNLVGNDTNVGVEDVFVRDMVTGVTRLVTENLSGDGSGNNHNSATPGGQFISADGRYVVFGSAASDLVQTPIGGNAHRAFLRDTLTGLTVAMSVGVDGKVRNGTMPVISPNGRYAAFISNEGLLAKDTNGKTDVYIYDIQTGTLTLASENVAKTNGGNGISGKNNDPSANAGLVFSADSKFLAFQSFSTDLAQGVTGTPGTNGQIYIRDLTANNTTLISASPAGALGDADSSFTIALSADAKYVAFAGSAGNLKAGDNNRLNDVFVRDRIAGTTDLASRRNPLLPSSFSAANGGILGSASADGRYVVFASTITNNKSDLKPNVTFSSAGGSSAVFVRDRQTGALELIDVDPSGQHVGAWAFNDQNQNPVISPDGRYVLFQSRSATIVPGITYTPGLTNIFLRDRQTQTTRIVSVDPTGTTNIPVPGDTQFAMSDDARFIAYTTNATSPYAGVSNPSGHPYILLRDMGDGVTAPSTTLVSEGLANDGVIRGDSRDLSISADGRYVLFRSRDASMATTDTNVQYDVYRWDRTSGDLELVSVSKDGGGKTGDRGASAGYPPSMTPDGRYVVFGSSSYDIVDGMPTAVGSPRYSSVYSRDMVTGVTSVVATGYDPVDSKHAWAPSIASNGKIVFLTTAAYPIDPPPNFVNVQIVATTGAVTGIGNQNSDGFILTGYEASKAPVISPDGRYVAFWSLATDIEPDFADDNGNTGDLYLGDMQTGEIKLVSWSETGTYSAKAGQNADHVRFSADGNFLFFDSYSYNLIPGDRNGAPKDVFAVPTAGFSAIKGRVVNDDDGDGPGTTGDGLSYWNVYLDANNNGALDEGETRVITDGDGNYAFRNLTPDTYTVAIAPQTHWTQSFPASANSYSVTINSDGTTITGKDFGQYIELPDLATSNVTINPATINAGQSTTVSWTVTNVGQASTVGGWQDAVYLSPTPTLGADAILLKTFSNMSVLAVNGQYTRSTTVVPPKPGTWYIIVQADRRLQVLEGVTDDDREDNNKAASATTVDVAIPTLALNTPSGDQLSAEARDRLYQFTAVAGKSLVLTLSSAASSGQLELYVKRGSLPTPDDFDFAARTSGQPGQLLTIPEVQPGTYYVLVHGVAGQAVSSTFQLTSTQPGLRIIDTGGRVSGGNRGLVTIPIHGTDLTPNTIVRLIMGPVMLTPTSIDYRDRSLLYATFDLTGQALGTYSVQVVDGSDSHQLTDAFEVEQGRGPDLQVHLGAPSAIRINRPHGELLVEYENTGDTDMPAPVFTMTVEGGPIEHAADLQVVEGNTAVTGVKAQTIQFVGYGEDSPAGILRAGGKGKIIVRVTLRFASIGGGGGGGGSSSSTSAGSGNVLEVVLKTLPIPSTPIDWNPIKPELQPADVSAPTWDVIWQNFTTSVGSTAGQFDTSINADTAYLSSIGVNNPSFEQIMAFEMMKADAALPVSTLGGSVDSSFEAPGLSLNFGRAFGQSISRRNLLGTLGRGWVSNWDITSTIESDGTIRIDYAGVPRVFVPDPLRSESYVSVNPGDHATLSTFIAGGGIQLRETDGTVTRFRADGKLDFVRDANGNRITAGFNVSGQLVSLTHSNGKAIAITYNPQGRVATVTDPSSRVATYSYDVGGEHLLSVTTIDGTTEYTYVSGQGASREHALGSVTTPNDAESHFAYDAQGRLSSVFSGTVGIPINPITITYPSPGGVALTDANNATTTINFNHVGQPAVVVDALGRSVRATYDSAHNLTSVKLPGGLSYSYEYDARGNMTRITDPLGQQSTFTYDSILSVLTGFTDPRGKKTSYQHNAAGDLLSITYPDASHQNFSYDPLGNLLETVNARGKPIDYVHDTSGRLTKVTFEDNSHQDYTYDARGNLTVASLSNVGGTDTTTLQYDSADRLTRVDYPDGKFLDFTYNVAGQRIQSVDHTGFTINYEYDSIGRLATLKDGSNSLIVEYTYDSVGRLAQKVNGNGTYTTYAYDAAGQLLDLINRAPRPQPNQDGPINSFFDYEYDDLGRVTKQTNSDGVWDYSYDATGQLTHAVFASNNTRVLPNRDLQYTYDAAGNRTQTIIDGVTTTYTVNDLNEYTQVGSTVYTYDADGNLKSKTEGAIATNYTFDDLNRLIGVSVPGDAFNYGYDSLGQFASSTHNGVSTDFLNDPTGFGNITGLGTLVGEFNTAGDPLAQYAWGLGLVSRTAGLGTAFYDYDMLGSTSGMTDATGGYVNRYSYLPFGETTALAAVLPNQFSFVGQSGVGVDGNGLQRMGYRNFDAITGQFISKDPLGLGGGDINWRRYVVNSPINSTDPAGLVPIPSNWWGLKDFLTKAIGLDPLAYPKGERYLDFGPDGRLHPTTDPHAPIDMQHVQACNLFYQVGYSFGGPWPGFLLAVSAGLAKEVLDFGSTSFFNWQDIVSDITGSLPPLVIIIKLLGPADPNHIVGPGVGDANWVGVQQGLPFKIEFENDPKKATVAAQDVVVTQQLDADLDWSTFEFGAITFGSTEISVPSGLQSFSTSVSTKNVDQTPLRVDISATLDRDTGIVTWIFRSLDPLTGDVPENVFAGFLPVNDETHRGEGYVTYNVRARGDRNTGTRITSQASIVFDTNEAIWTNVVDNTVDAGSPTGVAVPLPLVTSPSFPVSWSGTDLPNESGLESFDIFVSIDGGAWQPWLQNTTATSAIYDGELGKRYAFAVVAVDVAGNREFLPPPNSPEAATKTPVFIRPLGTIAEDTKSPTGVSLATLLGNNMNDPDAGAVEGVAVTGLVGNGKWEYSANGKIWKSLAGASESAAFLLPDTYFVRFNPAKDWVGTAGIVVRGWDQTYGKASGRAAVAAPDGGLSFSDDGGYGTVTVIPVNDRPVLPSKPTPPLLRPTPKSPALGTPDLVSSLVKYATDIDGDTLGVAITAIKGAGIWQFSTDAGTNWNDFPLVSTKSALLLAPTDQIRFNAASASGQASITLKAWDQTSGMAGMTVDSTVSTSTAFSTRTAIATTTINAAPTLAGDPVALTMLEDQSKFFTVSNLLAGRVTDDLRSLQGVAVTGITGGDNGTWQFSLNGRTWTTIPSISESNALLLRSADKIRYVPTLDLNGAEVATLTFRAWDQTFGSAGGLLDVSTDSASASFSAVELKATLTITAVADRPVLTSSFAPLLPSFLPGDSPSTASVSNFMDNTRGANGFAIVGASGSGTWEFSTNNGATWNVIGAVSAKSGLLIDVNARLRFSPDAQFRGIASLSVKGWDGASAAPGTLAVIAPTSMAFSKETGKITVAVNTAPTLALASPQLPSIAEDTKNPAGATVASLLGNSLADADGTSSLQGIAVTSATGATHGTWQFSTNGGRKWQSIGNVVDDVALLLRSTDKLRFLSDADFNGQVEIGFRGWNQTGGASGRYVDTTTNGGSTPFSTNANHATATISPANDAPRVVPGFGTGKIHLPSVPPAVTNPNGIQASALVSGWVIDPDGDALGVVITNASSANGAWEFSSDGVNWQSVGIVSPSSALALGSTDWIRFVPKPAFVGSVAASFRAWDQTKGIARTRTALSTLGNSVSPTDLSVPVSINLSPILFST